jgi:ParB-like chromosome segregation protein Spo0J
MGSEPAPWSLGGVPPIPSAEEHAVQIGELRESHAGLRVLDEGSVRGMRESLVRHGQLMAVAAYRPRRDDGDGELEVVDGFKRLRAARELGWALMRVRILPLAGAEAKAAIGILNHGRGLSELEEAWLVRSLYRDDRLTQPQIGRILGRHKSWVSRRLLLAEGLEDSVQVDVRLGLVAASTATIVARLPRCNQLAAAEAVMRGGLTKYQADRLVTQVLALPEEEREAALCDALECEPRLAGPTGGKGRPPERTSAQWLMADVAALTRICARLQARLWERPLAALGEPAARLAADGLAALAPVLTALGRTIERAIAGDHHVEDARRA